MPSVEITRANRPEHLADGRQLDTEFLMRKLSQEYNVVKTRDALTVLISRLRHKPAVYVGEEDLVKAIRCFGYKLDTPIRIQSYARVV